MRARIHTLGEWHGDPHGHRTADPATSYEVNRRAGVRPEDLSAYDAAMDCGETVTMGRTIVEHLPDQEEQFCLHCLWAWTARDHGQCRHCHKASNYAPYRRGAQVVKG